MKFVFPCKDYEEAAWNYYNESIKIDAHINGCGGLDKYLDKSDYDDWLIAVQRETDIANIPVPRFTYFYADEESKRIIGMLNIRLRLNDFFFKEGGHIGYSIRPSERRKGYGTMMLGGALDFLQRLGIDRVLITCDKNNLSSAALAKSQGGILEDEHYSETFGFTLKRYWIDRR
jgi:predicted acetyltransferase